MKRYGFDYDNESKVKAQLDYFTEVVKTYKDHPALLLWGVGNEVDLFPAIQRSGTPLKI